jgi:peroxiredoxin
LIDLALADLGEAGMVRRETFRSRRAPMTIAKGDSLPEATFRLMGPEGIETLTTDQVFSGKKVVLFAVPGAFTPTCHLKHLPGFLENADKFKAAGVDTIACVAVNDPFVLSAWAQVSDAEGKVLFLSDGNGEFTKEIGMDFDGSGIGLGTRSKRYAMVVEDGVVKALATEDSPGVAEASTAEAILKAL